MATQDIVPVQTSPNWVIGPPEGRDFAPVGFVEVDAATGKYYVKTTPVTLNTGWSQFAPSTGGGGGTPVLMVNVDPVAPPNPNTDGTMFYNRTNAHFGIWDLNNGFWQILIRLS